MDGLVKNMSFGWAVVGHDHVSGMGLSRQRVYEGGGVNVADGMDEIAVVRLRTKRRKKMVQECCISLVCPRCIIRILWSHTHPGRGGHFNFGGH